MFCVDEKTAIQALDRKDRMLPLAPGRAESHGFEYKRNGTLSLFAALNTATGEVLGKTAPRHTSAQFVAFLADVVASQPKRREIHVICDNVSSHKTARSMNSWQPTKRCICTTPQPTRRYGRLAVARPRAAVGQSAVVRALQPNDRNRSDRGPSSSVAE